MTYPLVQRTLAMIFALTTGLGLAAPPGARADERRGRDEAPAEKKRRPVERDRKAEREVAKAIARAVTAETDEVRASAAALVAAAEPLTRFWALADALDHGHRDVRLCAARGLRDLGDGAAIPRIVRQIVHEKKNDVRVELTRVVASFGATGVGTLYTPYLKEKKYQRRFRALQGMGVFPDTRLVRRLVQHLRLTLSGFPQVSSSFTTQRAYIRSWRMVSGGTGNRVVEIPDPEIDVLTTGVSLEVRVRRIEVSMTVELLQELTSQSFGVDANAWADWLARNPAAGASPAGE
ncbi:HEAT repeat domain-containing protein [Planctomycetota bacterium]